MSARLLACLSSLALLSAVATSCNNTNPCDGAGGGCLGLTITSATVQQVDTIRLTATGAFSGSHESAEGHAASLPVRIRATYPPSASGTVHVAVTGLLGGAVVGHGSGDVVLKPGSATNASIALVAGPGPTTTDMAVPNNGADLAGTIADLAAPPGSDMTRPPDMYRATLSFMTKGPFTACQNPIALALGNFQGKGATDIVVACSTVGMVAVLLQDATGNYPASPTTYNVGMNAAGVGVGRWHFGATKQDWVASDGRYYLSVAGNNGSGVFTLAGYPTTYMIGQGTGAIGVGDFNHDSADDVVFFVASDGSPTQNAIYVAPSRGNGVLDQGASAPPPPAVYHAGEAVAAFATGDLGNGRVDIVATMGTNHLLVMHNDGTGAFTFDAVADKHVVGMNPAGVVIADFDGNAKNDIATANDGGGVSILLNNGSGIFPANATNVPGGAAPHGIAAGDFDGDGNVDLAVTNSGTTISILLGDGKGHFAAPAPITVASTPTAIAAGDVNGDLKPDLAVNGQVDGNVTVLINTSH